MDSVMNRDNELLLLTDEQLALIQLKCFDTLNNVLPQIDDWQTRCKVAGTIKREHIKILHNLCRAGLIQYHVLESLIADVNRM